MVKEERDCPPYWLPVAVVFAAAFWFAVALGIILLIERF